MNLIAAQGAVMLKYLSDVDELQFICGRAILVPGFLHDVLDGVIWVTMDEKGLADEGFSQRYRNFSGVFTEKGRDAFQDKVDGFVGNAWHMHGRAGFRGVEDYRSVFHDCSVEVVECRRLRKRRVQKCEDEGMKE